MATTWRRAPASVAPVTQGSTQLVRLHGRRPNPDLPPVVVLHGWSASNTSATVLGFPLASPASPLGNRHLDVLLDTGRTLYCPYLGSNWGTNTTSPSNGGTGLVGIDDAIAAAAADGLTEPPDIVATSGGACSALVWGWTNPDDWRRMFLITPAFDLSYLYDQDATTTGWGLGAVSTSLRAIYSSTDKTEWLADSIDVDPYRNTADVATIADRIAVFAAEDDEVVPWANLEPWADTLDIPVLSAPGVGHLDYSGADEWDDLAPYRWLLAGTT